MGNFGMYERCGNGLSDGMVNSITDSTKVANR